MRKLALNELNRLTPEDFRHKPKMPICVVLDNIRSALNTGSIFRTSDAFAIQKIWLCGITAQPPHPEILKTAIGATGTVEWEYDPDVQKVVSKLREENWLIIGVEQTDQSLMLQHFDAGLVNNQRIALIFGNEVGGLSNEILPMLHQAIEIPQVGTKHSINVAVCAGIALWHFFQQWQGK